MYRGHPARLKELPIPAKRDTHDDQLVALLAFLMLVFGGLWPGEYDTERNGNGNRSANNPTPRQRLRPKTQHGGGQLPSDQTRTALPKLQVFLPQV